jgi:CheY-like chemotaxis protein
MGRTVLVADDNAATREFVSAVLEQAGYSVVTAANGTECLAKIEANAPHLLVLDLSMPGMGGVEALRRLRRREGGTHLPVIVFSGRPDLSLTADGSIVPAEFCLRKPVSSEALVAAVARALEGAK